MLDLFISHPGTCEACGREAEVVRVRLWDGSFSGLLCWDDLAGRVREESKDPECRKKFANVRRERTAGFTSGVTRTESHCTSRSDGESM